MTRDLREMLTPEVLERACLTALPHFGHWPEGNQERARQNMRATLEEFIRVVEESEAEEPGRARNALIAALGSADVSPQQAGNKWKVCDCGWEGRPHYKAQCGNA